MITLESSDHLDPRLVGIVSSERPVRIRGQCGSPDLKTFIDFSKQVLEVMKTIIKRALIHRYDNEPDILAVKEKGRSEVYDFCKKVGEFSVVIVVPTGKAKTTKVAVGDAVSGQVKADKPTVWPGRPDKYNVSVELENIQYTTIQRARAAIEAGGVKWQGQWKVNAADVDMRVVLGDDQIDHYELSELHEELSPVISQPLVPDRLKVIERVTRSYERLRSVRDFVISTRGTVCQLCGRQGFLKRDGSRYCEVHHLFQLSESPPPECLGSEYVVVLCATCHRRMHFAKVDPPIKSDDGWTVMIDDQKHHFKTRLS